MYGDPDDLSFEQIDAEFFFFLFLENVDSLYNVTT